MRLPARSLPLLAFSIGSGLIVEPAHAQLTWRLIPAPTLETRATPAPEKPAIQPRSAPAATPLPVTASTTSPAAVSPTEVPTSAGRAATQPLSRPSQGLQLSQASAQPPTPVNGDVKSLRDSLRIPPLVKREKPWPSPSLSPGVPSAFVANWGDVFVGVSGATAGQQRGGTVDGSWNAGFGLGSAAKSVALEISGGCGSVKDFCANGGFTGRIGRLLVNQARSRIGVAGAWQNFAQWGNEGRQDNVYYGALSYALPLRPAGSGFGQTLQFNAGVGNSTYAPFTPTNSQNAVGGFGSIGLELSPALGVSAGWSGRGANAQLSYTPLRDVPITLNVLGADLFNQTPSGAVAVFSISWGTNFTTPRFD